MPYAELEMLEPSERQLSLIDWNNTGTDFPSLHP